MDDQQQSRWQPTRRQLLWTGAALALLTIAILIGYRYGITLWDWIKLLVVPAAIAAAGLWFNRQQQERQRADDWRQQERALDIAGQRAQDEALQAYLDQMSQLLLDKDRPLRKSEEESEERTLAQARTLTVLERLLDGGRKGSVVKFLAESKLIKDRLVLGLNGAHLGGANLIWVDLQGADLRGADLSGALLIHANLRAADLRGANLGGANLGEADLSRADLRGAHGWTDGHLRAAGSLEGATMPNGKKYEDWLKDKEGRGEENSGPS